MKTSKNIPPAFGIFISILAVMFFFSGCSKNNNPADAGTSGISNIPDTELDGVFENYTT
jgi:hypothetical protein